MKYYRDQLIAMSVVMTLEMEKCLLTMWAVSMHLPAICSLYAVVFVNAVNFTAKEKNANIYAVSC